MSGRLTTKMLQPCCRMSCKNTMFLLSIIVMMNSLTILVAAELTAVVTTTGGPVQGEIRDTVNFSKYAAFQGMPFAEPPLGYRRFKPPVPVKPWTETRPAIVEGNDCPQIVLTTGAFVGSEDCLFINVYTPVTNLTTTPTQLKSVIVWIYGGGFTMGTSSIKFIRPDYILEKGVVFVSFNYRLGALGFLSLNHPNATGNQGLKDQVLALKWVQANIAKFGGNPKNVTILGQSAGSASVGYQVLSDAAVGLFHGTISMSGVPLNPWAHHTPIEAQLQGVKLGALLGTRSTNTNTLLKVFYNSSAFQIVSATSNILVMGILPFVPTIENKFIATDVFLATCPLTKYRNGNYSHVPQMIGFTDRETIALVSFAQPFLNVAGGLLKAVNAIGTNLSVGISIVETALKVSANLTAVLTDTVIESFVNETTDLLFVAGIDYTQRLLANNNENKPVYYYHVSYYPKGQRTNVAIDPYSNHTFEGAGHADDLPYIFYAPAFNFSTDPNDPTRRTINRVSTMWTNFAKYGNPTPNWVQDNVLNIIWPDSGLAGLSLDIGTELTVGPRPINSFTRLIQALSWPPFSIGCY